MHVNRIHFRIRKTFRGLLVNLLVAGCGLTVGESVAYACIHQGLVPEAESEFRTPDWAKGLVWYQVFPERFRNGNPGNDPLGFDQVLMGWDSAWESSSIEEIERAWNRSRIAPDVFGRSQMTNAGGMRSTVYSRRYGGDLQGVYEQLESIKEMGFTGIYLCPVFQSRSLHKYDASDHRHIDPTLAHPGVYHDPGIGHTRLHEYEDPFDETTWEWTESDRWFVEVFLPKAKSLGLRVMLDGVWNHVGLDHFAFQDVRINGRDSQFADWFEVVFDDDGNLIGWQGWSRLNGSLPEFRHIGDDIAPEPKAHVMAVTRRWMDPNGDGDPSDGIDGWRLDVAGEIGAGFWRDWRALVKSTNPDALIVAEIWHDADEMLSEKAFDCQMNYPFAYVFADWLAIGDEGVRDNAQVAANRLRDVFDHGREVELVQLNLMSSHDTERLGSLMQNRWTRGFDNESSRWLGGYESETVGEIARARTLAAFAGMIVMPGAPMVYNGDELALPGGDDPDNRRPIQWGRFTAGQVRYREQVTQLMHWRSDPVVGDALRLGGFEFGAIGESTLRVVRQYQGVRIEVLIAPEASMLVDHVDDRDGWGRDHETERKLMDEIEDSPISVRVFLER